MRVQNLSTPHQTGRAQGRKSNKALMLLSALGIIFVVDVHLGQPLSIFTSIFPYDSFFMPMFAFISGYFFKESTCTHWQDVLRYSVKKLRTLLLPYLGWTLFYNCLSSLLFHSGIWQIQGLSLRELIYAVVTSGVTSPFNSPAWFAPMLFGVSVFFCVLRRLMRKYWNDHIALILLLVFSVAAIGISRTALRVPLLYMPLKVLFFLPFYYLGFYFRKYWEATFDRWNPLVVCAVSVFINLLLIRRYGNAIEFPICSSMSGFQSGNLLLPLVTSITGTAFWLKLSKALAPLLGQNRLVNDISENTFFIMTHHIGAKHLFIGLCLLGWHLGIGAFSGIQVSQFLSDGLYLYSAHPWCAPVCFIFSMAVLLSGCKAWNLLKKLPCKIIVKKQP